MNIEKIISFFLKIIDTIFSYYFIYINYLVIYSLNSSILIYIKTN